MQPSWVDVFCVSRGPEAGAPPSPGPAGFPQGRNKASVRAPGTLSAAGPPRARTDNGGHRSDWSPSSRRSGTASDPRGVFTAPPHVFGDEVPGFLRRLGGAVVPWDEAVRMRFGLALAAGPRGVEKISAPVLTLPHGACHLKR